MSYLSKDNAEIIKNAKMKIRALNHPLRQKLLKLIKDHNDRIFVTDIYKKLHIEQSVASQHLAILRRNGFVKTQREGRTIWYSVNDAEIKRLISVCEELIG